jgi:hypothetical protein
MGRWWAVVRDVVAGMPEQRATWRKFGFRLMVGAGALAGSVYATVRGHPEQDLPLWPAWVLAGLSGIGVACAVATWWVRAPRRPDPRVDHRRTAMPPDEERTLRSRDAASVNVAAPWWEPRGIPNRCQSSAPHRASRAERNLR